MLRGRDDYGRGCRVGETRHRSSFQTYVLANLLECCASQHTARVPEILSPRPQKRTRHPPGDELRSSGIRSRFGVTTIRRMSRISRRVGIGLVGVTCAIAVATPIAVAHRTTAHAAPRAKSIANGFRVFNDYFCASCHVMKAAGPPSYRHYNVCDGDTACTVGVNFKKVHGPVQVCDRCGHRRASGSATALIRPRCPHSGRC